MEKLKNNEKSIGNSINWSVIVVMLSIVSIVAGIFFNYSVLGRATTFKFVVTGEKNEASLGNSVRIFFVVSDKGTENENYYNFDKFSLSGDWSVDEENHLMTCYNVSQMSEATIAVRDAENLSVEFVSEVGAGFVEVYRNDEFVESIDLYSNTDWTILTKSYQTGYSASNVFRNLSFLFYLLGVAGILIIGMKKFKHIKLKLCNIQNKRFNVKAFKNGLNTGIIFVVLYIVGFTALQTPVFNNIYQENLDLTITATGEKDKDSLANNVRITDIILNGISYELLDVNLENEWEYDAINYMLYRYDTINPSDITIPLKDVRTLEIKYVKEIGSGKFQVKFDDKVIDEVNSYKNCQWESDSVIYKTNPMIMPYTSYGVLIICFVIAFIIGYILSIRKKGETFFQFIQFININILLSFVLYLLIAFLQRESAIDSFTWAVNNSQNFFEGFSIIVLLNIILGVLFNKNNKSFICLAIIFVIFLIINYFKIQLRDVPLLPWDFTLIGVAASVVTRFKFIPSISFVAFLALFVGVSVALAINIKKKFDNKYKAGIILRAGTFIVSSLVLITFFVTHLFSAGVNLFEAKEYYSNKGFVSAFAESMQYLMPISEPENYNSATMNDIYNEINSIVDDDSAVKPNIIVLMSESFWDITRVKELGFNEEIFPTYRELQKKSVTGELLTNVYNGGTVNSEFEMLTGFSVAYLPSEYMPYQRCMRPDFFSINSYLKNKGYESLAIHPFEMSNYNRNTSYEYLGFDKTLWEDDFDENTDRMRGYVSDHSLTEKIIDEYEKHNSESDAPWFNLSISMQNHGGYWESSLDKDMAVDIDVSNFSTNSQGSIVDLATGLYYSDLALGELINYFEYKDEPTVIIMFGDHMSNAGPIGETLLDQSTLVKGDNLSISGKSDLPNDRQSILEQRRVPFMAWSNYEQVYKDCGIIDVTQLLPTVFSEYDIDMPKYFKYLNESKNIYPACASNIVVKNDGSTAFVSEMTEEEKSKYDKIWLIEYDYIFGENYLKDLFNY